MNREFERLAIIDHENHRLFIEDVDLDILEKNYHGEEEDYIKDNYTLSDNFSWEWIVVTEYTPIDEDTMDVEFTDLV